jgi:predicted GTPase
MQEIIQEIQDFLSRSVEPLQKKLLFHGCPTQASLRESPTILMLGNHSSGKSSFINYFIQKEIQQTGMAPTDEDFTILRFGPHIKERAGSSLVSNPEFGYEGLSQFGPKFLSHLKMKSLPLARLEHITLIDTPGMIDSADAQAHRCYDFKGVVRWFAERADLIMLFFDPERPGTTAETLQVYTQALGDFDHKLMVVMNKVDMFRKLPDFARCYGTLCWNLGKVMRTKDLPQIYVTYLPIPGNPPSALPMAEFELSRQKVSQYM